LTNDRVDPGRLTGLEYVRPTTDTAQVVSFTEGEVVPAGVDTVGPTLVFPAAYDSIVRFDVVATYDLAPGSPLETRVSGWDDAPTISLRPYYGGGVFDDVDGVPNTLGITESSEVAGDTETFHVAYADEAIGTKVLRFAIASEDEEAWYVEGRDLEVGANPTVTVRDVPSLDVGLGVPAEIPATPITYSGGDWAQGHFVAFTGYGFGSAVYNPGDPLWTVILPPSVSTFTLPDPPTGVAWSDLLPAVGGFRIRAIANEYEGDPWGAAGAFTDPNWARDHFVASAVDTHYTGTLVE
jgi:hypothetical protein